MTLAIGSPVSPNGTFGMDPATRPQPGGVRADAAEGCERLRGWRLRDIRIEMSPAVHL